VLDLVIRGGKILDGTGAPSFDGELCIRGERIAYIGDRHGERAARILDVDGMVIAPGFIGVRSHADGLLLSNRPDGSKVVQGVTTEITGNCGFAVAPVNPAFRDLLISYGASIMGKVDVTWTTFNGYLNALEAARPPINVGTLVGHGSVRTAAMGFEMRQARPAELAQMKNYVAEAMQSGALGVSTDAKRYRWRIGPRSGLRRARRLVLTIPAAGSYLLVVSFHGHSDRARVIVQ